MKNCVELAEQVSAPIGKPVVSFKCQSVHLDLKNSLAAVKACQSGDLVHGYAAEAEDSNAQGYKDQEPDETNQGLLRHPLQSRPEKDEPESSPDYGAIQGKEDNREPQAPSASAFLDWRQCAVKRLIGSVIGCVVLALAVVAFRHANLPLRGWDMFLVLGIGTLFLLNAATAINLVFLLLFGGRVRIYTREQRGISSCYEFTRLGIYWVSWRDISCVLLPWLWFLPVWAFGELSWLMGVLFLVCSWLVIRGFWNNFYALEELFCPNWCSIDLKNPEKA